MVSLNTAPVSGQDLLSEFMQYGRQGPFEEIVRRYAGMVFSVCLRVTKDKHDAEDAAQAVFLTLAIQARRGAQIKALGPWLQQVAKRLSLDLRRSKSRRKVREERHQTEETHRHNGNGDSLPQADLDEVKVILHEELNKLPTKYRLPLILHYFGGLSRDEMAAELGCKPSTLGVRIFRGREMLAGRLNGRGINMSSSSFAVALAYTIRSAVSHAMVASTSHAASALAVGHDGIGLVSARVIGLSRRAAGALAFGKIKLATTILILACTSLGAGAKAFGMLPRIDIGQIISNEVRKLIHPMAAPLSLPLRVDAGKVNAAAEQVAVAPVVHAPAIFVAPHVSVAAAPPHPAPIMDPMPIISGATSAAPHFVSNTGPSAQSHTHNAAPLDEVASGVTTPTATRAATVETADITSAAGGGSHGGGGGGGSASAGRTEAPMLVSGPSAFSVRASTSSSSAYFMASAANDLFVAPPVKQSSGLTVGKSTGASAATVVAGIPAASTSTQMVRIPAEGGTVISSDGILSGYGKVEKTGTLDVLGQVVATGKGVDRTLNLTSFTSVRDAATPDAQTTPSGWYAQDHGRLILRTEKSKDGASLVWGEDPADTMLCMVNSVRLTDLAASKTPAQLSLLASDRTDLPDMSTLAGVPVGIWQVDPTLSLISSADLSIRYNDAAVAALGDDESSLQLWTLGDGSWQSVDPTTLALNTADHTISGLAEDFSYFAVAVPSGNGTDISNLIALPNASFAPLAPISTSVPEPVGMMTVALSAGLLARRRRRRN